MQTTQTQAIASNFKVKPRAHQFLRLFILATAVTLLMSVWMAANAQTTTFYSGTYYPAPNYYYYVPPQPGYTYPVGPSNGAPNGPAIPPYVTTLPSNGYYSPLPSNGYYTPNSNYYAYSPPGYYSSPANSYPYPVWVPQNSVYYSGPAGGGGTIYSNSNTTSNDNGISYGRHGWNFNFGNNRSQSSSSTTVTTHR